MNLLSKLLGGGSLPLAPTVRFATVFRYPLCGLRRRPQPLLTSALEAQLRTRLA